MGELLLCRLHSNRINNSANSFPQLPGFTLYFATPVCNLHPENLSIERPYSCELRIRSAVLQQFLLRAFSLPDKFGSLTLNRFCTIGQMDNFRS